MQSLLNPPPPLPPHLPTNPPSPTPEKRDLLAAVDSIHTAEKPVNSCRRRESWEDLKRERLLLVIFAFTHCVDPELLLLVHSTYNVCQRVYQPYCCARPYFATYNTQLALFSPIFKQSTSSSPTISHAVNCITIWVVVISFTELPKNLKPNAEDILQKWEFNSGFIFKTLFC